MAKQGQTSGTLVVGAGLAGLGCALRLDAAQAPYVIVEAAPRVGGLARSEFRDGFTFDVTGHWLHLRDPETRSLVDAVMGDDLLRVARSASIHVLGGFVPYPFQTNVWALPPEVRADCLLGFIEARFGEGGRALREAGPRSFEEFVLATLGEGIARHFMLPYNRKLWQVDLSELSPEWTGRFVPRPSVEDVVRGSVGAGSDVAGYNAEFVYPREGGIQVLPDRLAERLTRPVELGVRVAALDTAERTAHLSDGRALSYDALVSTAGLPELVAMCSDAPDAVREAAAGLRATSVSYVNVAVRIGPGSPPLDHHWVYFPEPRFPFYRAGCASAAVPSLAPPGHRSFYVEFAHLGPTASADLEGQAVAGLGDAGLLRPGDEVLFTTRDTIPNAYVLFDHAHGQRRRTVFEWLSARGIRSVGRYGGWEYSSMEDALIAGREAADHILAGEPNP